MTSSRSAVHVSQARLIVLRAMYLLIVVGLGVQIWPDLLQHSGSWAKRYGDTVALLAGLSVMCLWGLWRPLRMLPVLIFELVWKLLWLLLIALPLWWNGQLDEATRATIFACAMGVVLVPLALPWGYVWRTYIRRPKHV